MQLTSKSGHMVVDFYEVQYANGDVSNRIALKVVTLMGETQSKRYIRIKDLKREVWSRVHNYGYKQTRNQHRAAVVQWRTGTRLLIVPHGGDNAPFFNLL